MRKFADMRWLTIILAAVAGVISAGAQDIFFPTDPGLRITSEFYDADGKVQAVYTLSVRNVKGTPDNGSQDIVYNFFKSDGAAYFNAPNEFVMSFTRKDGCTRIETSELKRMMFVQGMLPLGDASSVPVDIAVGDTIPDAVLQIKAWTVKTTVSVTGRKVLDHKEIRTQAGMIEAWLIREDVETKMMIDLGSSRVETWYARGIGGVSQKIFDKDGNLRSKSEIIRITNK